MIPVTQTKVVVRNSKDEIVVHGNCYAACIASMLELPISEVPNVEVFFHIDNGYWAIVMLTFLESKGYELNTDNRFMCYHDSMQNPSPLYNSEEREDLRWQLKNEYYLVSGKSARGVNHICIYRCGILAHDPHPSREGLLTLDYFQSLDKIQNQQP